MTTLSPMTSGSPEAINASDQAHVYVNRFGEQALSKLTAILLAISVAVNVYCVMQIRDDGMEQRLKQYNLDWFKTHEFAELKEQVAVDEKVWNYRCEK